MAKWSRGRNTCARVNSVCSKGKVLSHPVWHLPLNHHPFLIEKPLSSSENCVKSTLFVCSPLLPHYFLSSLLSLFSLLYQKSSELWGKSLHFGKPHFALQLPNKRAFCHFLYNRCEMENSDGGQKCSKNEHLSFLLIFRSLAIIGLPGTEGARAKN